MGVPAELTRLVGRDRDAGEVRRLLGHTRLLTLLHLSPRTVGNHLSSAYRKLGVGSRTAAIRAATQQSGRADAFEG